jgi:hypothetical protein
MAMVPTWAAVAVPVAVICVADTRFVVSAVVPKSRVAPGAKFAPVTVSVKVPTGIEVGVTEAICGVGLFSVTMLLAVMAVLAVSVALTVTELGVGGNCGAVYTPLAVIVPIAAFPPATPFTDQANAGVEPSLVFAVNGCESPPRIVAVDGITLRVACCGCFGCCCCCRIPRSPPGGVPKCQLPLSTVVSRLFSYHQLRLQAPKPLKRARQPRASSGRSLFGFGLTG